MKNNKIRSWLKRFLQIIEHFWFMKIRRDSISYAKHLGVKLGSDCQILADPLVSFGTEPWLIKIGNHVDITAGVKFITHEGGIWCVRGIDSKYEELDTFLPIIVGNNVIIGLDSIIMPGVNIGDNVIIAAHSVVTKNVADNTIVAGVPAREISSFEKFLEKFTKRQFYHTKFMSPHQKKVYLQEIHPEWFD